ncbi:hypothetical protein ACLOJK_030478 [Asimina triloba]
MDFPKILEMYIDCAGIWIVGGPPIIGSTCAVLVSELNPSMTKIPPCLLLFPRKGHEDVVR